MVDVLVTLYEPTSQSSVGSVNDIYNANLTCKKQTEPPANVGILWYKNAYIYIYIVISQGSCCFHQLAMWMLRPKRWPTFRFSHRPKRSSQKVCINSFNFNTSPGQTKNMVSENGAHGIPIPSIHDCFHPESDAFTVGVVHLTCSNEPKC